ncbi:MAG: MmcQ/YjbR family DNA-binding protein [Caldilineaceae bacterium]
MCDEQLQRLRRICLALPEAGEKLSHGEPTFFIRKQVFAMFANNHHNDGHLAVWLPVPPGMQPMLIEAAPEKFFKPPYVGVRGWVGIELPQISDEELTFHLHNAYRQIAPQKLRRLLGTPEAGTSE